MRGLTKIAVLARTKSPLLIPKCSRLYSTQTNPEEKPLHSRLSDAWRKTPTKWYPLPVGIGALLLVALQYRKQRSRDLVEVGAEGSEQIVRFKGPWQVHVMGALPLRSLSRLWGYLNGLELPMWFRPMGFKFYALLFGCNLSEIDPEDLTQYASLGEFFYRKLKPGARPIASSLLVSPADGRILHFGSVTASERVEQVKGITYSLDALLGVPSGLSQAEHIPFENRDHAVIQDQEFANVNGIDYTLDQLLGSGAGKKLDGPQREGEKIDASVPATASDTLTTAADMGVAAARPSLSRTSSEVTRKINADNQLFFAVIYLAPGDYHRFHSPAAWVVEKRRHFSGELFSVSPYMAKRLENLFVLNERVTLLGRWKHGFFSMVPVAATNVGSININFDEALRTNHGRRPPSPGAFTEAVYTLASPLLGGQPLTAGKEMGGFKLGSTIVLVFEAPSNFQFSVHTGEAVKVGQPLGDLKQVE